MKKSTMRVLLISLSALLALLVFVAAVPIAANPTTSPNPMNTIADGYSGSKQGGVSVSFTLPRGWFTKTARVGIVVKDTNNVGVDRVEAKAVQNGGWTDVTDTLYLDISDNATVYVQVTDGTGTVTAKSVYVECFDREKPTVRASRSGRLLHVEANDDLSGIAAIYVDGVEYIDHLGGALEVRINAYDNPDEKIWIQARDNAGNMSAVYTMTNPYYVDPDEKQDTSSQENKGKEAGNSTTSSQTEGSGSTTSIPSSTTATTSSSPDGNGTATSESDTEGENRGAGVIAVGDKQFITIETRDGKIFYLIIDGGRESDNVYLVTEATTQDLQSFTKDEAVQDNDTDTATSTTTPDGVNPDGTPAPDADTDTLIDGGTLPDRDSSDGDDGEIPAGEDSSSVTSGESNVDATSSDPSELMDEGGEAEESGKKANPIPGWIVILLILGVAAFAGYMFLVVLPRKKAKEAYLEDEDDEDEYMDAPTDVAVEDADDERPWDDDVQDEEE